MPRGANAKKYNDYPIPENQLTEIKSKIYATKYEAELKKYISKNFGKKGVNGLTKGLYKISSGNGFSKKYGNNEKAIGLVIEKENERRSKEGKPLLNDSEISEDELNIELLGKKECGDVHWIRVNGGDRYQSHPDQEARHAELIRHIESLPLSPKPTVTVWLLDWPKDHYHVKAYQNRLMAIGERATEEAQWDSRPMYDEVFMCYSGGVPK